MELLSLKTGIKTGRNYLLSVTESDYARTLVNMTHIEVIYEIFLILAYLISEYVPLP